MKTLLIILIALLPLATFAGNGDKKNDNLNININIDKNNKVCITGLKGKDLKKLEKEINNALKHVEINVTDDQGKEKHTIHFKAELNIE